MTPFTFDGPYAGCYSIRPMAMDERHVYTLHDILRGWPFYNALELGSFRGASSTAFVEAINGGSQMIATFCDAQPTESLWEVVRNCTRPDRVRVTANLSWHVLEAPEDFDFVLVDANHDLASVTKELRRLLIRRPLCVMAHDTNATDAGYPLAEGARLLRETFRAMPEYRCIEDAILRDGEQTERGLFCATSDPALYAQVVKAYAKWC